jgi:hypothetical protein
MLTGKSLVYSLEVNPWDMIRQVVLMECQSSHPMLSGLLFKPIVPTDCIEQSWKMPIYSFLGEIQDQAVNFSSSNYSVYSRDVIFGRPFSQQPR